MNDSHPEDHLNSAASIVLSLWLSLSSFVAVSGNTVMLWLFYRNESLRTISNRFLVSLSVADVLVGVVIDPVWIVIRCWIQPPLHSTLTDFMIVLWVHTTAATTFNICCVSIDRFIAIRFPFRHQEIVTKKRCYTVIILVWLFSMGLPFSTLLIPAKLFSKEKFVNIAVLCFLIGFIAFFLPLIVVSLSYISIFKSATKQFNRILAGEKTTLHNDNLRVRCTQNFKAIKTIGFVLGACIITWIPSLILSSLEIYYVLVNNRDKYNALPFVMWPWVETIAFTSSAINPFVYYFRNEDFRRAFRRTFRWLARGNSKESTRNTRPKQLETRWNELL